MRYLTLSKLEQQNYPLCILVSSIRREEIQKAYVHPYSLDPEDILVVELHQTPGKKKTPASEMKRFITEELVPTWTEMATEFIVVTDPEYFKILARVGKADAHLGYVMDCQFGPWKVIYVPNYRTIFYDPDRIRGKIAQGIEALKAYQTGGYQDPGASIIHFEEYPQTADEIETWLLRLIDEDRPLSCDIEAFSLKHNTAGIGTITFCWSKHEGIAFPVDLGPEPEVVRGMLGIFFKMFEKKIIWHNISYDAYVLIYQLYMDNLLDTEGLLNGLEIMLSAGRWEDTKLITYLATNSCAGNKLSLKDQSQEFSGNYALLTDDHDITKIPLPDLLRYNLIDGLSTWYVYEKHWQTIVDDQQLDIYRELFQPAIVDIVQMQLTGMPIDMVQVRETKRLLQIDYDLALNQIETCNIVQQYTYRLNEKWVTEKNNTLKKKRVTLADANEVFNPNSGPQLQDLLYNVLHLPVISFTDSKQPSTDKETLKALRNHTTNQDVINFLNAVLDYASVNTILTTFIPALEGAVQGPDGWHYLFGNFNLGGTLSGRLSSSKPNLQNIPANGTKYAKLIKMCFAAPPGWIFVGLDFSSLEDRISALTTKDPNKLKVYQDGFDGHSLRAQAYFNDQMQGIDSTSVESINSIQKKYPELRQDSKAPTFALTYQGTWITLMTNCGFSQEKAKLIEKRYHEMYKVSDDWVASKLDDASRFGYVTVAFGLRVRTPKLVQVIRGTSKTPFEAEAEGRTAGNALGQSWCLLNNRAWIEFMTKVRASPYRTMIRPCAQIHDAGYALVKDDIATLLYTNEHLVKAVEWQDHPDITHPDVKLGGELSIFAPDWSKEIHIPIGASEDDIYDIIDKKLAAAA